MKRRLGALGRVSGKQGREADGRRPVSTVVQQQASTGEWSCLGSTRVEGERGRIEQQSSRRSQRQVEDERRRQGGDQRGETEADGLQLGLGLREALERGTNSAAPPNSPAKASASRLAADAGASVQVSALAEESVMRGAFATVTRPAEVLRHFFRLQVLPEARNAFARSATPTAAGRDRADPVHSARAPVRVPPSRSPRARPRERV